MIDVLLDSLGISGGTDALPGTDSDVEVNGSITDTSVTSSESVYSDSLNQHNSLMDNSLNVDQTLSLSVESQVNDLSIADNFENQTYFGSHLQDCADGNIGSNIASEETLLNGMMKPFGDMDALQQTAISESTSSSIDVDNLINTPNTDNLEVSNEDIDNLQERANGIERSEPKSEISFGKKMCSTRHGCQGATDCDYSYGGYG